MISVIRYEGAGINQRASKIVYSIAKGLVAERLQKAIEDGEGHMTADDLVKLDAQTLSEGKLRSLFSKEELLSALHGLRDRLNHLEASITAEWASAQGGEGAYGFPPRGTKQPLARDADGSAIISGRRKRLDQSKKIK